MKRILILNNGYYKIESYVYQSIRLKAELEQLGAKVVIRENDFFPAFMDEGEIRLNLSVFDACVFFDKDKYVSEMLEKCGLRLFNKHEAIVACDDKMSTYIALSGEGIKMPKTLPGALCYTAGSRIKPETMDAIERQLNYPLIVKESFGSLGKGVYKAINRSELEELANKLILKPHHFQRYIASSEGRDVRLIVIGKKAVASMLRSSQKDFRSNIELGGKGTKIDVDDGFRYVAEKVAKILDLDYCGVDILFGSGGEPIVCEVNSNAFFGGIEKVTKINVAKIYAEHIMKTI